VLAKDEEQDTDRHEDHAKAKFTLTECVVALLISLVFVTLLADFLVNQIDTIVERGLPDQFLGLILLPLVEKAAEHLTAIDEAWDNQMVGYPFLQLYNMLKPVIELCPLPLSRSLYPDRALQCTPSRPRRLGTRKAYGSEF
jgi:calcium/proton exchanger cax